MKKEVLILLKKSDFTAKQLSDELGMSLNGVRKTLRRLRDAGLIERYTHWYGKLAGYTWKYKLL